jgi:hypothetical protein
MQDFVSVPVPVERVQEVYELLARQPSRLAHSQLVTQEGYPEGWSQGLLDRMFLESSSAMRRILNAIAKRPDKWVTTRDIAEASGLTARQVVASFGPFGKRIRGRYGMSRWPFETREFVDAGVFKYCMASEPSSRIGVLVAEANLHEAAT